MRSTSAFARILALVLPSSLAFTAALDVEFDRIECDESLPVYASATDVQITCNDGTSTRCTFGQNIMIQGSLQYHNLDNFSINATGYTSANLRLMSVEYNLFEKFPLDFCGSWVQASNYSDSCPGGEGVYSFNVPYTLPSDDDDITTWFATGWQGVSDLEVYSSDSDDSTPLSYCQMYWNTYVTPSEVEGWRTMPSSAQTGIIVGSVLALIICCCCYSICCRRRKRHVTDVGYYDHDDEPDYQKYEEKGKRDGRRRSRSPNNKRVDSVEESRAQ